jgi:hypothetical protein
VTPEPIQIQTQLLGGAKIDAEGTGRTLNGNFQSIRDAMDKLQELGISISLIKFDDYVTQAAWMAFIGQGQVPMMTHEDDILRAVSH